MEQTLPFLFERTLYQAVIRYKLDHPGELEAITKRRKEEAQWKPTTESIVDGMEPSTMSGCPSAKRKSAERSELYYVPS